MAALPDIEELLDAPFPRSATGWKAPLTAELAVRRGIFVALRRVFDTSRRP